MSNLLVFRDLSELNWKQFFAVCSESVRAGAAERYPDLEESEAILKYKADCRTSLPGALRQTHGMLLILEKEEIYRSLLFLTPQDQNRFLLDRFETHPEYREMGFGKKLLQKMMLFLHQNSIGSSVCSRVSPKNKISIQTHRAAGFYAAKDEKGSFCMIWNDAQLSRIDEQEARLDRILASDNPSSEDIRALAAYYESPLWRIDFESDEAGQIPEEVKRGVLSEDAIYDVLTTYQDLLQ